MRQRRMWLADKMELTRTVNLLEALKSRVKNDPRYASIKVALAAGRPTSS